MQTRSTLKTTKPMNKRGKVTRQWAKTRADWIKRNYSPIYYCHYCSKQLDITELTLDHKESRGRHPELRNVLDNLVPCCYFCNASKGSKSHDEIPHVCTL